MPGRHYATGHAILHRHGRTASHLRFSALLGMAAIIELVEIRAAYKVAIIKTL